MPDLSFRASLKSIEVEEIIDLLIHRPLGYVLARASYPTPVSPDQLTVCSMIVGVAAGALVWTTLLTPYHHLRWAGALFILSAVIDCSDGQLARMRQSSSTYGRMLDGAVDAVVQIAVVPGLVALVAIEHARTSPHSALAWTVLMLLAIVTGLQHTVLYDHFKNVYLHNTRPQRKEGDDPEEIEAAYKEARARGLGPIDWLRFYVYRRYLKGQRDLLAKVDPFVPRRFAQMPAYSDEGAARYRELHGGLMRLWSFYGIGTHIFGTAVSMIVGRIELYIVARLAMNLALVVLVPWQRRASRAFFEPASAESEDLAVSS